MMNSVRFLLEIQSPAEAQRFVQIDSPQLPKVGQFLRVHTRDCLAMERVRVIAIFQPAIDRWTVWGESLGIVL